MAKAAVDTRSVALAALAQAVADPGPRILIGTKSKPGFFIGSGKLQKDAAKLCEDQHWLARTGEYTGAGKARKELYRITPAGIREVLDNSETAVLLRGLLTVMQQQADFLRDTRAHLESLAARMEPMTTAVAALSRKIEPPDVEKLLNPPTGNSAPAAPEKADWLDHVLRLVAEQKQRHPFEKLTLPRLYDEVRRSRPALTVGQFHDGLRTLYEQHRIRLTPYTQALATLDDPRNALYLDREVKFYADVP